MAKKSTVKALTKDVGSLGDEVTLHNGDHDIVSIRKKREDINESFSYTMYIEDLHGDEVFRRDDINDEEGLEEAVDYLKDLQEKIAFVLGELEKKKEAKK